MASRTSKDKEASREVKVPIFSVVSEMKEEQLNKFVSDLYDTTKISDEDIKQMWESFSYKGFNRTEVLQQLAAVVKDTKVSIELIVAVAMRGPQAAAKLRYSNGLTPIQMGIPASGGKGARSLTLNKILSATADLAAYVLKKMNVPKRMNVNLPGWLQYPSAGSIKLPDHLRTLHIEFSKAFSPMIGGGFQEQIYAQMQLNAYLDPKLQLFD
jgi:hypothetical protein